MQVVASGHELSGVAGGATLEAICTQPWCDQAHADENVRERIWLKRPGNACFNPVSLLVGGTTDELIDDRWCTVYVSR
ncbi:hypothetical protein I7860_21560 [Pseudomonas tolaasii]|uniref:hypothetical protein n=1 Tax=Pseudomonas tolaasii TaxID=29442 RepID=UPI001C58A114|nr:hypothetical protein [Pseudomonas tolaasii]MBW1249262.1 hypothetical protein [Pseudomonas tolaasii]